MATLVRNMRNKKANTARPRQRDPKWYAKEWLAHKHLQQSDVVARTDYNKGQVSEYVSGTRRWNADVLVAFADVLGISTADLLRPPQEAELTGYVMGLSEDAQARAFRLLRALSDEKPGKN